MYSYHLPKKPVPFCTVDRLAPRLMVWPPQVRLGKSWFWIGNASSIQTARSHKSSSWHLKICRNPKRKKIIFQASIFKGYVTRWWFQIFSIFTPKIGEMIQFDEHIFQMGWNHHLEMVDIQIQVLYTLESAGWSPKMIQRVRAMKRLVHFLEVFVWLTSGRLFAYLWFLNCSFQICELEQVLKVVSRAVIDGFVRTMAHSDSSTSCGNRTKWSKSLGELCVVQSGMSFIGSRVANSFSDFST